MHELYMAVFDSTNKGTAAAETSRILASTDDLAEARLWAASAVEHLRRATALLVAIGDELDHETGANGRTNPNTKPNKEHDHGKY